MTHLEKPFSLSYHPGDEWITIRAAGPFDAQVALDAFRAALPLARQHRCRAILLDTRETDPVESYERGFDFSKNFSKKTGITPDYRCAILYNPDRYPPLRAKLMETVVKDESRANLKWFVEEDAAEVWLRD